MHRLNKLFPYQLPSHKLKRFQGVYSWNSTEDRTKSPLHCRKAWKVASRNSTTSLQLTRWAYIDVVKRKKVALLYTHTSKIRGFSPQWQARHWSPLLWLLLSQWIQTLWIINQIFWQFSNNEIRCVANNDTIHLKLIVQERKEKVPSSYPGSSQL